MILTGYHSGKAEVIVIIRGIMLSITIHHLDYLCSKSPFPNIVAQQPASLVNFKGFLMFYVLSPRDDIF